MALARILALRRGGVRFVARQQRVTWASHYHAHSGLVENGRIIKGLDVFWMLPNLISLVDDKVNGRCARVYRLK